MKISGIYKIQSIIKPERIYIGSSVFIHKRWGEHLRKLKKGVHCSAKLQRHYNKYGKDDLVFSILISCDKADLIITEQFFIDSHNPYFNNCKVAGSSLGVKLTDETKQKMSECKKGHKYNLGNKLSEEHKRNIGKSCTGRHWKVSEQGRKNNRDAHRGLKQSKETCRKRSESMMGHRGWSKGKKASLETCNKLSESHKGLNNWTKGRTHSEETLNKMRVSQTQRRLKEKAELLIQINSN